MKWVIKNPQTWMVSDFDQWGSGEGIGEVINLSGEDDEIADVRWPGGCSCSFTRELIDVTDKVRRLIREGRLDEAVGAV